MKDLVLLVADKNMQFALKGILSRPEALGTRLINYEIRVHVNRDGGARVSGAQTLALERRRFAHGLLVLDFEGSGAAAHTADALEGELNAQLNSVWGDDARAIVISPELDVWMWGGENVLKEVFDWPLDQGVRDWLRERDFEIQGDGKPARPKEALEALIPVHRLPRSSAFCCEITSRISLRRCQDPAFNRLRNQLQRWFPKD